MIILITRDYYFFQRKKAEKRFSQKKISCFLKCVFVGMKHLPEKSLNPAGKTLCSFDKGHI